MKLKANFHFHAKEDISDSEAISYSLKEGIDYAASLGFEVLTTTFHKKFWEPGGMVEYAASKNILLIPGIELEINGKHIVVLNCDREIDRVSSFEELAAYKKKHPDIFVLAAHPYFRNAQCLGEDLEKNISVFDGVEFSWFYSKWFNLNKKAEEVALKNNLSFVATSDTHFFDFFDKSYAVVNVKEKSVRAVIKALHSKKFKNVTSPRNFWKDIVWRTGWFILRVKMYNLRKMFSKKPLAGEPLLPSVKEMELGEE